MPSDCDPAAANMIVALGCIGSRDRHRRRAPQQRWALLTPTVLWSIVILAMAPSLHGFGLGSPAGRAGAVITAGSGGGEAYTTGVAAAELASGGRDASRRGSLFGATSWFKKRVRNGRRRLQMQVMSMVPETQADAIRFADAPVPIEERGFQINGWRWHTRAVLRDITRFRRVVLLAAEASAGADGDGEQAAAAVARVVKCYDFLWSFSFAKLHKVETTLFFPWLRDHLPQEVLPYLDEFDRERDAIIRLGTKISQLVEEAEHASNSKTSPRAALLRCADLSQELERKASRVSRTQEAMIMPLTAAYISEKEQWKFNDKVILSLGLVNAQVFLVSMHDAIKPDKEEFKVFRSQVPKFARALIPTWRRVLYSPRAGCMDEKADVVSR